MINNKSFTLIELLVVIVIIGILAGVVMISTSSSIDKANIAKLKVFEESVQNNLAANMVSAWDADHVNKDGTSWTLNDKWGNNHGTFYDGTEVVCSDTVCPQIVNDNQMGNVLSFDGVNDYIDCGNSDTLKKIGSEITAVAWIKRLNTDSLNRKYIFSNDRDMNPPSGGFSLYVTHDNKIGGMIAKNSNSGKLILEGNLVPFEKWQQIVFIFNGKKIILFQDGNKFESVEIANDSIELAPYNFRIGIMAYNAPTYYKFNGLIKEIKIYNEALPDAQIKQNYIAGLNSMLTNGNISKQEYNERINNLAYDK
ncbi:MAG: LamG-like jellyroll fold domain-containing protein [Minisyncoccales bacterium]